MLKFLCFAFALFIQTTSYAQSLIPVNIDMFQPGNYWVWEYKTIEGEHNSFEKYLVLSREGSIVTFEMQTQLADASSFSAHHRFTVDIDECLQTYEDYSRIKKWRLKSFKYKYEEGRWLEAGYKNNTQVFEEKFNCHRYIDVNNFQFKHSLENSYLASLGEVTYSINHAIYPRKGHADTKFIFQPYDMASIAGYKIFNTGKKGHEYTFELSEWKMDQ